MCTKGIDKNNVKYSKIQNEDCNKEYLMVYFETRNESAYIKAIQNIPCVSFFFHILGGKKRK